MLNRDKIGVIDLGTNTFNLLVAEKNPDTVFKKIFSKRIPVMLGERTMQSNLICESAFERGLNAMKEFSAILKDTQVSEIRAIATSALRTSHNASEFVAKVHQLTGIEIKVISGEEEAELIFRGNSAAANLTNDLSLIMDIGGGSTEFIVGSDKGIVWKKSFLLGAARLLDKFKPEDPISADTISKMEIYFDAELIELFEVLKINSVRELIGSSGAFDSFVEMIDADFNSMKFDESCAVYEYDLIQFRVLSERVIKSTLSDRLTMRGLIPMRVEMIVLSVIFTNYILKKTGIKKLRSTTWSLKEGAVLNWISE